MTAPSYKEYLSQIEDLQKKASAARKAEVDSAIREVRRLIAEYQLNTQDIGLDKTVRAKREAAPAPKSTKRAARKPSTRKVPPKYIGPNGELWTGRGRRPVWVTAALRQGASLSDLLIPATSAPVAESALPA